MLGSTALDVNHVISKRTIDQKSFVAVTSYILLNLIEVLKIHILMHTTQKLATNTVSSLLQSVACLFEYFFFSERALICVFIAQKHFPTR